PAISGDLLERPPTSVLHRLFEHQAAVRPAEVAAVCGGERLTYGELERRANQLARLLRSAGVVRGDRVALLLPRSLDIYVALLGILKSGAAYVPLDAEYPAERVGFILSDCDARALVTNKGLVGKAGAFAGTVIMMEESWAALSSFSEKRLDLAETGVTPENL